MGENAELLEAAEYFAKHQYCECDYSVGVKNCMGCDIDRMASYILATVHADDDEPVTVTPLALEMIRAWSRIVSGRAPEVAYNAVVHYSGKLVKAAARIEGGADA